jgi:deoxyribose-phosphate aldolase
MPITVHDLAKMIDHSLLHPTMTDAVLKEGCELAAKYDVASVCIKPYAVAQAVSFLSKTDVKVGSVIGFPHGNSTTKIKVAETSAACADGAVEIDMVINIGKALGGDWSFVQDEMGEIHDAARKGGAILKVIFENDYLTDEHIVRLCQISNEVGVEFVKTSSGYGFVKQGNGDYNYHGATAAHLKLMRAQAKPAIEVKAAGGVRTLEDLLYVRSLGVTRVGATATAAMLDKAKQILEQGRTLEEVTPAQALGGGY